ncbi:MAG TPA: SRPBCC family protein [Ktedonobacterales bacterium]
MSYTIPARVPRAERGQWRAAGWDQEDEAGAGTLSCESGVRMPTFERSIEMRAEAGAVFDLAQDYNRRLSWDPFLREARLLGGATQAGLGVRAWCVARNGLGMETEYVSFSRPSVVAVRMTRGPWLFRRFAGTWRFTPVASGTGMGTGRTRVTFRYQVSARPSWLGWLLDPPLLAIFARESVRRRRALKRAAEGAG